MKNLFFVEVTDLFCGELNYSYCDRYIVSANTMQGACNKIARQYGLNFRRYYGDSDSAIYHSATRLTGYSIQWIDDDDAERIREHYNITEI